MSGILSWIGRNKILVVLLLVIGFLLVKESSPSFSPTTPRTSISSPTFEKSAPRAGLSEVGVGGGNRVVIKETTLSLVVGSVSQTISAIQKKAEEAGGFLVSSSLDVSEGATDGTISVRVPEPKMQDVLNEFKKLATKVVSENISGQDVTDQYVDLDARLSVLQKTKAKFEAILETATKVSDLLDVQRELINIQKEIDDVKGQQKYLDQSAKLSLVTVYLSTDELSLPYTPEQPWSPDAIFKQAVRALVSTLRSLGSAVIWITVFAPVWIPAVLIVKFLKRRKK